MNEKSVIHLNVDRQSNIDSPDPDDVISLRLTLQSEMCYGITAAQDKCAEILHTSRRSWQQWERGERKMHPAFWELINIKLLS